MTRRDRAALLCVLECLRDVRLAYRKRYWNAIDVLCKAPDAEGVATDVCDAMQTALMFVAPDDEETPHDWPHRTVVLRAWLYLRAMLRADRGDVPGSWRYFEADGTTAWDALHHSRAVALSFTKKWGGHVARYVPIWEQAARKGDA